MRVSFTIKDVNGSDVNSFICAVRDIATPSLAMMMDLLSNIGLAYFYKAKALPTSVKYLKEFLTLNEIIYSYFVKKAKKTLYNLKNRMSEQLDHVIKNLTGEQALFDRV